MNLSLGGMVVLKLFLNGPGSTQRLTRSGTQGIREQSLAMSKTLSEILAAAKGAPIQFAGLEVVAIFDLELQHPSILKVEFVQASKERPQAVQMKVQGGSLTVNQVTLNDAIFWTDTAPARFQLSFNPTRPGSRLKIWNGWKDHQGLEHAWIGNSGMHVVQQDGCVLLECSDGIGEPTFDDLVVRLTVTSKVVDFSSFRLGGQT